MQAAFVAAPLPIEAYKGTLNDLLTPPDCSVCNGSHPPSSCRPAVDDNQRGLPGIIAWLPRRAHVPSVSCAHEHLRSDSAFDHPCLVLETSACGHLAFCAQVTSFGDGSIHDKYERARDLSVKRQIFNEYVNFREDADVRHNQLGELDYGGDRLPKQSYVHLEFGFWIEHVNLSSRGRSRLWEESLSEVRQLYASAENHRRTNGSCGQEKLRRSAERQSRRPVSPPSASLNVVAHRRTGFGQPSPPRIAQSPQEPAHCFAAPPSSPSPQHHHHQQQQPEPPLFQLPRRGNAALRITAPVEV